MQFDQAELRSVFTPAIRDKTSPDSQAWRAEIARLTRKKKKSSLKKRIRRWLSRKPSVETYEDVWSLNYAVNRLDLSSGKPIPITWGADCFWAHMMGIKRVHLYCLARLIDHYNPSSVLEVGFGPGQNLFIMSRLFPEISFTGIEPTGTGLNTAKHLQGMNELPPEFETYSPLPVKDGEAYKRISFMEGDARNLPFETGQFDLVFTMQAVEQMWPIRTKALPEIARVSSGRVVLFEPFADFNQSPLRQHRIVRQNVFREEISALPKYGLKPALVEPNLPSKFDYGVGLVVTEKTVPCRAV